MHTQTDTIFALSSGGLPSGVAIIRLSGPDVVAALARLAVRVPRPRVATLAPIANTAGDVLDIGLVLYFPGPQSFTGEDCAELHVHGGRAVVAAVLAALAAIDGLRHAEPGEFTRRAFTNGKLDLTATEALADLIAAETEAERRLAVENHQGAQRVLYEQWRADILATRALVEANLDFSDEADVTLMDRHAIRDRLRLIAGGIEHHVQSYRQAEIVRDGFRVALVGAPNTGKSSLLNALARRDVAIVTDVPGTTRDLIEVRLDLDGHKVIVTDTAGIRESADRVERIGIERARTAAGDADLVLSLSDGIAPFLTAEAIGCSSGAMLVVRSKADLGPVTSAFDFGVSSLTGAGLEELINAIAHQAGTAAAYSGTIPSRRRHVDALRRALDHIDAAIVLDLDELLAEELRLASDELGRITGMIETEELLGAIFGEFCIGK